MNQLNRIDSRARGNAPQLLEKYKKLAHDSQLNGDRVQAEYYLQFADHYFRVIADNKAQKDEARAKRDAERGHSDDDDGDDEHDRRPRRSRQQRDDDDRNEGSSDDGSSSDEDDSPREPKRRARKPRNVEKASDGDSNGLDASVLPPSIGRDDDEGEEKKPRRARRPKPRDDDDKPLEAVN